MVFSNLQTIALLTVFCFAAAEAYFLDTNVTRYKRQSTCGITKHQCGSGECVEEDVLCDGKVDCQDGSDETSDCAKLRCQPFLFRCTYGACINPDYVCDGKQDCKDNSDETNSKCNTGTTARVRNCGADQFECNSGQCIDDIDQCDGISNCEDGSDETAELCGSIKCQPFTFRCAYGACINENSKCNGVKDCIDNSDEIGCPGTGSSPVTPTIPPTVKPTNAPPTQSPVVTLGPDVDYPDGCVLPPHPANGKWKLFGGAVLPPGRKVKKDTVLQFECNTEYRLFPENVMLTLCMRGTWGHIPKCIKTCPTKESSETTIVTCDLNGSKTSCKNAYQGTRAYVRCATLYEDPTLDRKPYRFCNDGSWDFAWPNCEPVCGLKSVEGQKLIINGTDVVKGDYPWQIGIYLAESQEHICGGSVISPKFSLTAAHCFEIPEKNGFLVAAGKYYRGYNDKRDVGAQFTKIAHLIIHEDYNDGQPYLAFDLAIIVHETPFKMNKFVLPVCFDPNKDFDYSNLVGKKGIITGWGFTTSTGAPSETLKMLEIEYKNRQTCTLPSDFRTYYLPYAPDKLCAGLWQKGQSACSGDSGGGLVFLGDDQRYFIRGIVSVSPQKKSGAGGCDESQLTLFTAVPYHTELIIRTQSQFRG